jgi:alpha-beta hydrolase superfamily lysophospholipase
MHFERVRGACCLVVTGIVLAGCGNSPAVSQSGAGGAGSSGGTGTAVTWDRTCDLAPYPSAQWTTCEVQNYAKTLEAPEEELINPTFQARVLAQSLDNAQSLLARDAADPSWLIASSPPLEPVIAALADPEALAAALQQSLISLLTNPTDALSLSINTPVTPLCASYAAVCMGDPFRWPEADGPDGSGFYNNEATVIPVVFYDSGCARLSGHVWQPKNTARGQTLPGVVITNGSIQAPEPFYWPMAETLVRAGYVVLTYDPRGQGRSDFTTPTGVPGTNVVASVFWTNQVDAIDFFRSTPQTIYPNNTTCKGYYPTVVAPYNPAYAVVDPDRLGIAGHSLGAIAVSVVQGYGAPGADPWPGKLDHDNPVKAAVAWDSLITPNGSDFAPISNAPLPPALAALLVQIGTEGTLPKFGPRVPSMSFSADYGLFAQVPYLTPPNPDGHKLAYQLWQQAGVPVFELAFQGTTHLDFSPGEALPATSWCPDTSTGACSGGYAAPAIRAYTVAWFDRWLKKPGEGGYDDADARLLNDGAANGAPKMSFRFRSARDFPDRSGKLRHCEDIRAGC